MKIRSAVLGLCVLAVACSGAQAATPDEPVSAPGAGMCAEGMPDCIDVAIDDDEQTTARARGLLGRTEDALDDDVRIARRGGEHFALTEDYVVGRLTVELDVVDGHLQVVAVRAELQDGPATFTE